MAFSRWLQPHDVHLPIASQSLFKLFSFLPDSGLWQWSCCALFLPLCNCDVYSDRRLQSKTRGLPLVQVFVEFVNFLKLINSTHRRIQCVLVVEDWSTCLCGVTQTCAGYQGICKQ